MENKILFNNRAWHKLKLYTKYAPGEISGLGLVEVQGDTFYVEDVYLFKQKSTGADTILDRKDVAKFISNMMDENIPTEKLKLWWHTHGNMGVFWSKTDENNIEDFDNESDDDNWILSVELNKDERVISRFDLFSPVRITLLDLPIEIESPDYMDEFEIAAEVKEKIEEEKEEPKLLNGKQKSFSVKTRIGKKNGYSLAPEDYDDYDFLDKNGKPFTSTLDGELINE